MATVNRAQEFALRSRMWPFRRLPANWANLLRLRDTDEALRETATEILRPVLPAARLDLEVHKIVAEANAGKSRLPAHRALADATAEFETWLRARQAARDLVVTIG